VETLYKVSVKTPTAPRSCATPPNFGAELRG
jgi:hypothetical protein